MRTNTLLVLLVMCLFSSLVFAAGGDMGGATQDGSADFPYLIEDSNRVKHLGYVPNEIIVKFKEPIANTIESQLEMQGSTSQPGLSQGLDELNSKYRVQKLKPLFKNFKKNQRQLKALQQKRLAHLSKKEKHVLKRLARAPRGAPVPDLGRIYKIELDLGTDQSLEDVVATYKNDPDVEYAELNYLVSTDATLNDPLYSIQWSLNNTGQMYPESGNYNSPPGTPDSDIDASEAWDITIGSSEVIIAVIDTGVDYTHRDLDDNMWTDVNGCHGYDFINDDNDPIDDHGHGTHCSGIIAAEGDNGLDITGVCWDVKIMALKFLGADGTGPTSLAASAFYYAVDNGADVISNSWGGGGYLQSAQEAIDYAYSQGVVIIAAAGNDNTDAHHYPACYDHVISVAATNSNDGKAPFSNYGNWVDIAAPGVDILSLRATGTSLGTTYDSYTTIASGTSMACPTAVGVTGLIISKYPLASVDDITAKLIASTDDISPENPGYDGLLGSGRLNAYKALGDSFEGKITVDKVIYSGDDIVAIKLFDGDLISQGTQPITVTTDGGDEETVTLLQDASTPWIFTGTIRTSPNSVNIENGFVEVAHNTVITITYTDIDYGNGSPATVKTTSLIDNMGPVIYNIETSLSARKAIITFETDEPTIANIQCGLLCGGPYDIIDEDLTLSTSHVLNLTGLTEQTDYYFLINVEDAVGNTTTEDNSGACYSFTTTEFLGLLVPSLYPTIQAAVDEAIDGDTVIVANGTYTGSGNRNINFHGKAITVKSENGHNNCVIDCQGIPGFLGGGGTGRLGFIFNSGESRDSVVDGFTITKGHGKADGIENPLSRYYFYGGAIYCRNSSSPTIKNCIIKGNYPYDRGGAIWCRDNSSPIIENCVIRDNQVTAKGGAIYAGYYLDHCNLIIKTCLILDNDNHYLAGAIHLWCGDVTINNCVIAGNSGIGIYLREAWPLVVVQGCTIYGNLSGGLFSSQPYGPVQVSNCIFWNNGETEIYSVQGLPDVNYCDVEGGYPGPSNINADPCFVNAAGGDYHLQDDSRCINRGDPYYSQGIDEVDMDGQARVMNLRVDIGADESVSAGLITPIFEIEETYFDFFARIGLGNPDPQVLHIYNSWQGTLNWTISCDCDWLQAEPSVGTSVGIEDVNQVLLRVDITDLAIGPHYCNLTISDPNALNSPQVIEIALYVGTNGNKLYVPLVYPTIQSAIDASVDGDTVVLEPNTYTGEDNRNLDFTGKAITVQSIDPEDPCVVAATVIDCENLERSFYLHSGEDANSKIAGLTITNGSAYYGGAIYCEGSSPYISNCVFKNNYGSKGGGLYNHNSSPTVINCAFINNISAAGGGGVYSGGYYSEDPDNDNSSPLLTNCLFRENSTPGGRGGAIYSKYSGETHLVNCTLVNNTAPLFFAGAIYCAFTGTTTIDNCILWGNSDSEGTGENSQICNWRNENTIIVNYSCVQGWSGTFGGTGNIGLNPLFISGSSGDYYLSQVAAGQGSNSPCVDTGNDIAANIKMDKVTTRNDNIGDQGVVDMGYHYPCIENIADLDGDGDVDLFDFSILASQWQDVPGVPSSDIAPDGGDGVVDGKDLKIFTDNWLGGI